MEICTPDYKTQENVFNLRENVETLQARFIALSNRTDKAQQFYSAHIDPLLTANLFNSLVEINRQFKELDASFEEFSKTPGSSPRAQAMPLQTSSTPPPSVSPRAQTSSPLSSRTMTPPPPSSFMLSPPSHIPRATTPPPTNRPTPASSMSLRVPTSFPVNSSTLTTPPLSSQTNRLASSATPNSSPKTSPASSPKSSPGSSPRTSSSSTKFTFLESKEPEVLKGYQHLLELYRLYFLYHFILTHPLSSSEESLDLLAQFTEINTTQITLKQMQGIIADKKTLDYQSGRLKTWVETSFQSLSSPLQEKITLLNEEVKTFNNDIIQLENKEEKKIEKKSSQEDLMAALFLEENYFSQQQDLLGTFVEREKSINLKSISIIEEISKEIGSITTEDKLHRALLENEVTIHFDEKDNENIGTTVEVSKLKSECLSKIQTLKHKSDCLQMEAESITPLLTDLETLESKNKIKKGILSGFSISKKVSTLLNDFTPPFKRLLAQKKETLLEDKKKNDALLEKCEPDYQEQLKHIVTSCYSEITEKINKKLEELHKAVLAEREEKRSAYINALKLKFSITSCNVEPIKLFQEKQAQQARALDQQWSLIIGPLVSSYQQQFAIIKAKLENPGLQQIQENIVALEQLHNNIDSERYSLITRSSQCNATRQTTIKKIIDNKLAPLMETILKTKEDLIAAKETLTAAFIKQTIDSYQSRFEAIKSSQIPLYQKIPGMQKLSGEIALFYSQYAIDDAIENGLLENVKNYLSHENIRKSNIDEQVDAYKLRLSGIKKSDCDISTIRKNIRTLNKEFLAWRQKEMQMVLLEYSNEMKKYNNIMRSTNDFTTDIKSSLAEYTMPKYSFGWALFWAICIPLFGWCIYEWWYSRQCHLARANAAKEMHETAREKMSEGVMMSAMGASIDLTAAKKQEIHEGLTLDERKTNYDFLQSRVGSFEPLRPEDKRHVQELKTP